MPLAGGPPLTWAEATELRCGSQAYSLLHVLLKTKESPAWPESSFLYCHENVTPFSDTGYLHSHAPGKKYESSMKVPERKAGKTVPRGVLFKKKKGK